VTELSALVVLRPARGRLAGDEPITAETVGAYAPDAAGAAAAEAYFRDAGFSVTDRLGLSFSITAPASRFEDTFGTSLVERDAGVRTEAGTLELPLERVPGDVAAAVETVTFTPPPDFGPTKW